MGRFSILALLAVAGCAAPTPVYVKICPVLVNYPLSFSRAAGAQIMALPPGSPLTKMVEDYIDLRAQVRTCK